MQQAIKKCVTCQENNFRMKRSMWSLQRTHECISGKNEFLDCDRVQSFLAKKELPTVPMIYDSSLHVISPPHTVTLEGSENEEEDKVEKNERI